MQFDDIKKQLRQRKANSRTKRIQQQHARTLLKRGYHKHLVNIVMKRLEEMDDATLREFALSLKVGVNA